MPRITFGDVQYETSEKLSFTSVLVLSPQRYFSDQCSWLDDAENGSMRRQWRKTTELQFCRVLQQITGSLCLKFLNSTSAKLKWRQLASLCGAKCSLYQEWWPFAILHRSPRNKVKRQDLFPSDMVDFSLLGALWTHLSWEFSALPVLRGEHLIAFLDILFRCTLSSIKCCSHAAVMANSALSALAFLNFSLGYSQNASSSLSSLSFPSSSFLPWERLSQCNLGLLQSQYPPVLAETKLSFESTDLKTPPVFMTLNSFSFC